MTSDESISKKFRMIRDHGTEQKYHHLIYGHNYRMESIQGAVLGIKLKHLEKWTDMRRKVAKIYNELLANSEQIILPREMKYSKHVYHLFVIKLQNRNTASRIHNRDALQKFLLDNGISTGLHYPVPLHLQPCFEHLGYMKGDFPVAEELAEQSLSLPMFPELNDNQIEYVCEKIQKFLKD